MSLGFIKIAVFFFRLGLWLVFEKPFPLTISGFGEISWWNDTLDGNRSHPWGIALFLQRRPIGSPPERGDGTGRRNHGHNREGGCKRKKLYFGTEVFKMEAYAYWVVFERSNQKKGTYLTRRTKWLFAKLGGFEFGTTIKKKNLNYRLVYRALWPQVMQPSFPKVFF